eukprot:g27528.t1
MTTALVTTCSKPWSPKQFLPGGPTFFFLSEGRGGGGGFDATTNKLQYTAGRSATHDTCANPLSGTPSGNEGCWDLADKLWLRFEDNKAFLSNRGLQHWGERSEIIRLEIHDVGLAMNVFGEVWIDKLLMDCRSSSRGNPMGIYACTGLCGTSPPAIFRVFSVP